MLSVNTPHAGLRVFGSLDCGVDYDGLLFLFCMRLLDMLLCAFRVWTDAFSSLYVSEFLIAACGVSPLRGRLKDSALKNPAALKRLANFFLWVRVCGCCAPEPKKQKENRKNSSPTKINLQSIYNRSVFFRYLLQLLTLYRTVAVYHRSALIRKQCRPERHLIVRPEHHRQI